MAEKKYIIQNAIDGFKNELMDKFITLCCGNDYNKLTLLKIGDTIDRIYDEHIDKYTNIDVAPVVHGQWIDKPTGSYGRTQTWCSACGKHSGIGGIESNRHKPYCPNCGARMDGIKS